MRMSFLWNRSFRSWILSFIPSIRILLSLLSKRWLITFSYFIIYWYCLLFLSRCYTYFLLWLLCFPRQLLIPNVESKFPLSACPLYCSPPKDCPYRERNMSFLGERTSFKGLLDWFLGWWGRLFLKGFILILDLLSSTWRILALCKSNFWVWMKYMEGLNDEFLHIVGFIIVVLVNNLSNRIVCDVGVLLAL